jgi:nucleotide-binding universal stress UspA family protein
LAELRSADISLVWVHPYERLPSLLDDDEDAARVRESVAAMASVVKATLPADLRPELELLSGNSPSQGLQQLAERDALSMIVLGPSERSGMGRISPGSTAVRLLSGSSAPVAIAPRGYTPPTATKPLIGVGFDGSVEAQQALDWAANLARHAEGRLRVIAVHQPFALGGAAVGAFPTESVSQVLHRELRSETEEAVAGLDGVTAEVVMADGDPATVLAGESATLDLLVLGSRAYGPVRSVLMGTVSEATVAVAESPVVIVPRGADGS